MCRTTRRLGSYRTHKQTPGHGAVRRGLLFPRLASRRSRVIHRQFAYTVDPPIIYLHNNNIYIYLHIMQFSRCAQRSRRIERYPQGRGPSLRHGHVQGSTYAEATTLATALRAGHVGRRAAQGAEDRRARREGVQGHKPRGRFLLRILGQQEAHGDDAVVAAAGERRHRYLRLRCGLRRLRRRDRHRCPHQRLSHHPRRRLQQRRRSRRHREDQGPGYR